MVQGRHERIDRAIERHGVDTVVRALEPMLTDARMARIEAVLDSRLASLVPVIENLHDPHNGAAAIRSIEAIGLSSLHVVETVEAFRASPAVTIGAEKWIDVVHHRGFEACAKALRDAGIARIYAACPDAQYDLENVDTGEPVAVVFGNEHAGLSDQTIAACDGRLGIPMHGFTQSFNLSVSMAVTLYRLAERRRHALGRSGDLDDRKRAFLRARWYAQGIRGLDAILARHVSSSTR